MYGELIPQGGGDPIPLFKPVLLVGRRESADVVLRFPNVSGSHCELTLVDGYWFVKDLASSNGTKVNGVRVSEKRLDPGDKLTVARHHFEISYEPSKNGAVAAPADNVPVNPWGKSLLESAGLESRRSTPTYSSAPGPAARRPDPPSAGTRGNRP
jgi:pSer/pThr/pTyr-binding forkhead associated (FHA) protein